MAPGTTMKTTAIVLVIAALLAIGITILVLRQPELRRDARELGHDVKRGARDALDATKDAAEDAADKVRDVVK